MIGAGVQAGDSSAFIPDLYRTDRLQLRTVDTQMSAQEYREAAHKNQRILRKALRSYLEGTITSLGVPKRGVEYAGAAMAFAVNGAKMNLNDSKTMSLELSDPIRDERALFFKVHLNW
jgi:hypothetical protein